MTKMDYDLEKVKVTSKNIQYFWHSRLETKD